MTVGKIQAAIALLAPLLAFACRSAGKDDTDASNALPACKWPAIYEPADASAAGRCTAGRTSLQCKGSAGGGLICQSDNSTRCLTGGPKTDETYSDCQNQCEPAEYAVWCNLNPLVDAASGTASGPPSGCRDRASTPGVEIYCCPCGK